MIRPPRFAQCRAFNAVKLNAAPSLSSLSRPRVDRPLWAIAISGQNVEADCTNAAPSGDLRQPDTQHAGDTPNRPTSTERKRRPATGRPPELPGYPPRTITIRPQVVDQAVKIRAMSHF